MKAETPEPIDHKRALTDVAYFAEKFLDIKLFENQINYINNLLEGTTSQTKTVKMQGQITDVAVAFARHKGIEVKLVKKVIDV